MCRTELAMKLLLIEDEEKTAAFLQKGLTEHGFVVDLCRNGEDGLQVAAAGGYNIVVLDVMLPGQDGWSVLKELRCRAVKTPVVMLTARESVDDRVKGLTLGADDYLIKPFAFAELLARIHNVLRRLVQHDLEQLTFIDLTLNVRKHRVTRGDVAIDLTPKEFLLLSFLLQHQGDVVSRTLIAEQVWDMNFDSDSNVVDVHIRRLRTKVDEPFDRKVIHTIRGRGYVLR